MNVVYIHKEYNMAHQSLLYSAVGRELLLRSSGSALGATVHAVYLTITRLAAGCTSHLISMIRHLARALGTARVKE